ncbi:hypothetical protein O0I10_012151 [Lichtheimia ornata]|uniref:tRNA (adenine(58)-N(1))-methyltransferase non-catalytic subunit TRM6 n=1 Tax=Lichtheimia ornata TaxID=688661 RepID=A0AAD7USA3_9FUNG|nr:uncharacterized protein O0I10_012151 [Lichtheimia ornata]KAJ8652243.1 hypothetical protein O0I10_012151 [Lichtheimia ornata]
MTDTSNTSVAPTVVPVVSTVDDITEDFPHVRADQYVLIQMPSGNVKIVSLKPNTQVSLGKFGTFNSDNLIDKPFGVSYEIYDDKGNIRPVRNWALDVVEETNANNQMIIDNAAVQKLSHQEVETLKAESLKGNLTNDEIIQKIISSHAEFDKKTEFSKAKYIERKKKKFMKVFTPVRPTLYQINELFFNKNPEKIKGLRVDTLSQILSLANVRSNSKVLVVDDTQGLIVSAVAERMGGYGTIVAIHDGDNHNYDVLRYMNFSRRILDTIHTVPLSKIDPADPNDPFDEKTKEEIDAMGEFERRRYERKKNVADAKARNRELLFEGKFDALIISSPYEPSTVVERLFPYISGSRRIVIYGFTKDVLIDTAAWMRKSTSYLSVDISESFLRQYQVLPGRTHPEMTTSGGGGYLLSALKVIDCPEDMAIVFQNEMDARKNKKQKRDKKPNASKKQKEQQQQS